MQDKSDLPGRPLGCEQQFQVGETYLATDPERMVKTIRQVKPIGLAFKILAAGRRCQSPEEVRHCFD